MSMFGRLIVSLAASLGIAFAAHAQELATEGVPTLARDPQSFSPHAFDLPAVSPWTGFYVGSEISALSRKGARGLVGGAAFVGYNREFDDKVVLGVETSAGFMPYLLSHSRTPGFDFATTKLKLGYDMGRLMPFVSAGVILAKPQTDPGLGFINASDSVNHLFSSTAHVTVFSTIGAGFDYALTNNLSVGLAVSANRGGGFRAWP
jgi:opacity protein-like surface antigen